MKVSEILSSTRPHLAVLGGTGAGKTTLVKTLLSASPLPFYIIDWDGEYNLPVTVSVPPFPLPPNVDVVTIISELDRPNEGGHGIASAVRAALEESGPSLQALVKALKSLTVYNRGEVWAAWARVSTLARWFEPGELPAPPARFDLSVILDIRERAWIQQALATAVVLSRPLSPSSPVFLVIEEGGMGATANFLKDLLAHARRRGVRLIYVSQDLPPRELLSNFVLIAGDPGPARYAWSRELGLPLPPLSRGEFLCFDGKSVKRVRVLK